MKATFHLLLTSVATLFAFAFTGCQNQDEPKPAVMDGGGSPGAVAIENPYGVWRSIKDTTIYLPRNCNEYVLEVKSMGFEKSGVRDIRSSKGMTVSLVDSALAELEPCERKITQFGAYINQRDTICYYKQRLLIKDSGTNASEKHLSFTIHVAQYDGLYSNFSFLVK